MIDNGKRGVRQGGLRGSAGFDPEPDLDHANVGRYGAVRRGQPYVACPRLLYCLAYGQEAWTLLKETAGSAESGRLVQLRRLD